MRAARAEQERAAQEHAAQLASAVAAASSPGPGINVFQLLRLLPAYTATKLLQINAALSPEEQAEAMQVLKSYSVEGMHELLTAFDANPVDECTAFYAASSPTGERAMRRPSVKFRATPS